MVDSGDGNVLYWICLPEIFAVRLYYSIMIHFAMTSVLSIVDMKYNYSCIQCSHNDAWHLAIKEGHCQTTFLFKATIIHK